MRLISRQMVEAAHTVGIERFGGLAGPPDIQKLEGALGRPQHLMDYAQPTVFDLTACYAVGLAKAHAFPDGNKRVAFLVTSAFLAMNGFRLEADEIDAASTFFALAAGELDQSQVATWLQSNSVKRLPQ